MVAANPTAQLESSTRFSPFGPPLLLEGEDPKAYDELFVRITDAVRPSDFIEEMWIRETADLTWEILRWRRLKASLLNEQVRFEVAKTIRWGIRKRDPETGSVGVGNSSVASNLVRKWSTQNPAATRRVEKLMATAETSMDTVSGRALEAKLNTIERIEHLITITEARRNAVIREIDRHRDFVAGMLQSGVQQIEDAEFTALETKEIPNQKNETVEEV